MSKALILTTMVGPKHEPGKRTEVTRTEHLVSPQAVDEIVPIPQDSWPYSYEDRRPDANPSGFGPQIECCSVVMRSGLKYCVEGSPSLINDRIFGEDPCNPPRVTGLSISVAAGEYILRGECGGDIRMVTGYRHNLDPRRLTGGEWEVIRMADSGDHRYQLTRRTTPVPLYTLQQWIVAPRPGDTGAWRDVTSSVLGVQAGMRLRLKPTLAV